MSTLIRAPLVRAKPGPTLSPAGLAAIWGALLIFMGLFFRTYDISMASAAMEFARQIGTPFIVVELAVTAFAVSNGLSFADYWKRLSRATRALVAMFFSTFWVGAVFVSKIPLAAIMLDIGVAAHVLFGVSLYHCVGTVDQYALNRMRTVFLAALTLFTVMIFHQFVIATPPHEMKYWQYAVPGFISVRLFGAVCGALCAFFLIATLINEEARIVKSWHYLALAFVTGLMIWTGTRAAILGVGCALATAFIFYRVRPAPATLAKLCATVAVAATVATLLLPPDPTFWLLQRGQEETLGAATVGRLEIWKATWDAFLTVPMFGAGPAANSWMMPPGVFAHVQPHNVVLQFLINWGIMGALPAFALLGTAIWHAHRIVLSHRHLLAVLAMLDCLLVMSLVDGILYFARETMMVMMCFAIIFRADRAEPTPA